MNAVLFFKLGKFSKSKWVLQFHVLYFDALQFANQLELDLDHLSKVGAGR